MGERRLLCCETILDEREVVAALIRESRSSIETGMAAAVRICGGWGGGVLYECFHPCIKRVTNADPTTFPTQQCMHAHNDAVK
jgi:hypothetical protein